MSSSLNITTSPGKALAMARYFNTNHGFQPYDNKLIVAMTPPDMNIDKLPTCITSVPGFTYDDFIGHPYLAIDSAERDRIPGLVDALLATLQVERLPDPPKQPLLPDQPQMPYQATFVVGYDVIRPEPSRYVPIVVTEDGHIFSNDPFKPFIRLQTKLRPMYTGGDTYSIERSEQLFIAEQTKLYNQMREVNPQAHMWQVFDLCGVNSKASLWKTPEGKALARDMADTSPDDFGPGGFITRLVWATKCEHPLIDFPLTPAPPTTDAPATNEPDVCMICLDRPPNTLVLPCMDCVVCRECSEQLKQTPDATTCVRCRRPIHDILSDTV